MRNFLLITDIFAPYFCPRHGAMCKYIREYGWDCSVISLYRSWYEDMRNFESFGRGISVKWVQEPKISFPRTWINCLTAFPRKFCGFTPLEQDMIAAGNEVLAGTEFDLIVISCSDSVTQSPNLVGRYLSKRFHIPYVVDIRDLAEQHADHPQGTLYSRFCQLILMKYRRPRCWRDAAHLIPVSDWHREFLLHWNPNTTNIYNGFDPDIFKPVFKKTDHFVILFAGTIEDARNMDYEMFFRCLGTLVGTKRINKSCLKLKFYVKPVQQHIVRKACEKFHFHECLFLNDRIEFTQMPEEMASCSIALLFSNRETADGPKGIRTTKLFEYMAMKRPVLCTHSDENEMERLIRKANAGCSARTDEEACDFLEEKYQEWLATGTTTCNSNDAVIQQFSRRKQAGEFATIFDQVIQRGTAAE